MSIPSLSEIIIATESLYQQLPTVRCKKCSSCCVSPTCTVAEFIYLMNDITDCLNDDEISEKLGMLCCYTPPDDMSSCYRM